MGIRWTVFVFCLFAVCMLSAAAPASGAGNGFLTGRLVAPDHRPLEEEAVVIFFDIDKGPPPRPDRYWRLPDDGAPVADDGRFTGLLPEGRYYFGVIRRPEDSGDGQPGFDQWLHLDRDKLGNLRQYRVSADEWLHIGDIVVTGEVAVSEPGDHEPGLIMGRVIDEAGRPMANVVVEAFLREQSGRVPVFSSEKTGEDGRFRIRAVLGTYYLRGRLYGERKERMGPQNALRVEVREAASETKGVELVMPISQAEHRPAPSVKKTE